MLAVYIGFLTLVISDSKICDFLFMNNALQVDHLKPGTSYSFRLRVVPKVVPPLVAPASPAPSDIAVFSTLSAAPSQR